MENFRQLTMGNIPKGKVNNTYVLFNVFPIYYSFFTNKGEEREKKKKGMIHADR